MAESYPVVVAYTLKGENGSASGYVALEAAAEAEEAEIIEQAKQKLDLPSLTRALDVFKSSFRIVMRRGLTSA